MGIDLHLWWCGANTDRLRRASMWRRSECADGGQESWLGPRDRPDGGHAETFGDREAQGQQECHQEQSRLGDPLVDRVVFIFFSRIDRVANPFFEVLTTTVMFRQ